MATLFTYVYKITVAPSPVTLLQGVGKTISMFLFIVYVIGHATTLHFQLIFIVFHTALDCCPFTLEYALAKVVGGISFQM